MRDILQMAGYRIQKVSIFQIADRKDMRFSKLLSRFDKYIKRIDHARHSLEFMTIKKTRTSGRYETLGIPGRGDKPNIAKKTTKVKLKELKKLKDNL